MPVTKSAKKKLRKDRKREIRNKRVDERLERMIKDVRKAPSLKKVQEAFSLIDRASKKNIIHKNKAARIKSALSKLVVKAPAKTQTKSTKSSPKKSSKPSKK